MDLNWTTTRRSLAVVKFRSWACPTLARSSTPSELATWYSEEKKQHDSVTAVDNGPAIRLRTSFSSLPRIVCAREMLCSAIITVLEIRACWDGAFVILFRPTKCPVAASSNFVCAVNKKKKSFILSSNVRWAVPNF